MSNEILAGGLTKPEIDKLKKTKGGGKQITLVTIHTPNGEEHFWFKKPDMNVMSASAQAAQQNVFESAKVMFINCLIKGDESAIEDVDRFNNIAPELNGLIETYQTEVKNF